VRLARLLTVAAAVFVSAAATMVPLPAMAAAAPARGAADTTSRLRGDLAVHDPALVAGGPGENWYVFSTGDPAVRGGTLQIRTSRDGRDWVFAGTVWDAIPAWLTEAVPGVNNLWAPEVYRKRGIYYLYYVASTFGSNRSVIALATNTTLDPDDPDYEWVDRGPVVRSVPEDDFNAIDPGIVEDDWGTPWMAFGSYWSGIRMVPLQWPSGLTVPWKREPLRLADRQQPPNAIEAPYVVRHAGWYYLFVSFDTCCRGVESTYRVGVGRSRQVTGPYVDRDGRGLLEGGGTAVVATAGDRVGPGGQSASDGILAYHYYDATAGGQPRLALQEIYWTDDGWPTLSEKD
jgi:arabinan endo-1,5-alpha-L-arabinosidase